MSSEWRAAGGSPLSPTSISEVYPTHRHGEFMLRAGRPFPYGASFVPGGVNFSVFSHHAAACTLVLFERGAERQFARIPFLDEFRIGAVFAMMVFNLDVVNIEYGFQMEGEYRPEAGHRFDGGRILLDPYAKAIAGRDEWGEADSAYAAYPYRARLAYDDFDWAGDRPLNIPASALIIYETHVRGFTRHPSSGVQYPGTFAALREKIPYLKNLGVNCVELMPVHEFDEFANKFSNPETGEKLWNYWGYNQVGFFAPKAGYASGGKESLQMDELKALVKTLHQNGIEVILDVVFNHTAEEDNDGPTFCWRGIDNKTYYMLTPDGDYYNFSGCGNTMNCNNPIVREMVIACLRYWAVEYHIDGFRFDLASILGRGAQGRPLENPPLLEAMAYDPVLSNCKLIAEAWDAGGLYQVGSFPAYGRWAEWNDAYRDTARRFLRGDMGQVWDMAQRLQGSPDMYADRGPSASINFITSHDGFTLHDLFAYNEKHNWANGEENRDGHNENYSWNCGVEGATMDPGILTLRERMIKNSVALLLLSQGVPMLSMGDEMGHSKRGNNNTYCHDNDLNWLNWERLEERADLFRFFKHLIAFRKAHPALRRSSFLRLRGRDGVADGRYPDISWHGVTAWQPDWSHHSRTLAFMISGQRPSTSSGAPFDDFIYAAMNMHWKRHWFELPSLPPGFVWHTFANTGRPAPNDVYGAGCEPELQNQEQCLAHGRSLVILVGKRINGW